MKLSPRGWLLGLLLFALASRLVFWIGVVGLHGPLRGDELNYQDHAVDLSAGKGFINEGGQPSAARPPLFPMLLGGLYRVFGVHVAVGRIFQILLGVATVGLTYLLASRIFSTRTALVAAGLAAVNPYLIFISSYLLTENLYTVLVLTMLVALELGRGRHFAGWGHLILGGLVMGLASLCRPNAIALAGLVVPAILVMASGGLPGRMLRCAIFLLVIVLTIMPWTLRNHAKLGTWVVFTTHGGITFYQSNNQLVVDDPGLRGGVAPRESLPGWELLRSAGEVEGDREAWRMGKTFLREHPRLIPQLAAWKFVRFWRLRSHAPWSGVRSGWWWNKNKLLGSLASNFDFGIVYAIFVIPCFVVGILVTRRDYPKLYLLYAALLVHTLVALVFYGSLRARIPIEPVIATLAAAGGLWIAARVRGSLRRFGRTAAHSPPM